MRAIGWIMVLLLTIAWLACEVQPPQAMHVDSEASWRRTCNGWERARWLTAQRTATQPTLHPVVIGLLQLLLAVTALVAFSRTPAVQPAKPPRGARERGDEG